MNNKTTGNISEIQYFTYFTIAHQLNRRLRIIAPCLYHDKERAHILQILLLKNDAIEKVKIVPELNSVTICFDPESFPKQKLLELLDQVLANFSQKPQVIITKTTKAPVQKTRFRQKIMFGITGMRCASCALFLEMVLSRKAGILHASINYLTETGVAIGYLGKQEIFNLIEQNGYHAYSIDTLSERKILLEREHQHLITARKRINFIAMLGIPVILLGLLPVTNKKTRVLQALLSLPVVFTGGREIFNKSWLQVKQRALNMDTLIAMGAGSAFGLSIPAIFDPRRHAYFDAATAIIGFVQLGRYLEELAKNTLVEEVKTLVNLQPQNATLLKGEIEYQIAADKIQIDDLVLIRPGERAPVDGIVMSGLSSVDESMISGSSTPCIKEKGHLLFEGSINGSGVLRVKATAIGKDTKLASLVKMIDQAQSSKLLIQKMADTLASRLMPAIMSLSTVTFIVWLAKGERIAHAFSNALSVLLIACPCVLSLATPAATSVSASRAARRKIFIRNGHALEVMASIDSIIFDKTGTLTVGNASVVDFLNISKMDDDYVVQLAASVEINSEHLLGKAIVEYAKSKDLSILASSRFHSVPDQGVRSQVDGHEILLGNGECLKQQKIDYTALQEATAKWALQGSTLIYLVVDNNVVALFALQTPVRKGLKQLIDYFHTQGIETMLLTSDTEEAARPVAEAAGIKSMTAQTSPAEKIQFIRELQAKGQVVAMVGDGINDAPALAAANVSLVVGDATGIAIEAADFVLIDDDIGKVAEIQMLSKQTLAVVKQNLFWAFVYNGIAIPVAMVGKLTPMISSAAMALSSLSVIANSLRLGK